jgi:hypothetical protein
MSFKWVKRQWSVIPAPEVGTLIFLLRIFWVCVSSVVNYLCEILEMFGLFPWLWIWNVGASMAFRVEFIRWLVKWDRVYKRNREMMGTVERALKPNRLFTGLLSFLPHCSFPKLADEMPHSLSQRTAKDRLGCPQIWVSWKPLSPDLSEKTLERGKCGQTSHACTEQWCKKSYCFCWVLC